MTLLLLSCAAFDEPAPEPAAPPPTAEIPVGDNLSIPTPWGTVTAFLSPTESGTTVDAHCACTFTHDALGGTLSARVRAQGALTDSTFSGTVSSGKISAQVEATVGGTSLASGTFTVPETPIADIYAALAEIVPEADRADMRGKMSAKGDFTLVPLTFHVEPKVEGFAVEGLVGPEYRVGPIQFTGRDEDKNPVLVRSGEGTAGWMALAEFGPMLPMAVVAAEDAGFYSHVGYDLSGMSAAAKDNEKAGKIARGGSTLSQQLAKNLFLTPERTYARKLREILYAVEMERELGKDRILELYLNVVEWGPHVRGGLPASEAYFLKKPAGLLPEEAAFMSSILRNPRGGWEKQYVGGRVETRRLKWILDNMRALTPEDRLAAYTREVHFVPPGSK